MKTFIIAFLLTCFSSSAHSQNSKSKTYKLIIDTYTNDTYQNVPEKDGIFVYDFNSETGDFTFKSKVSGEGNPSFLAVSKNRKYVYSLNEFKNGEISAFSFNEPTGELTFLNRVSSGGDNPCYIIVDDNNGFVFVGNYGSGTLTTVALNNDGSLSNNSQIIKQEGSSINTGRQRGPHVHSAVLSPDNRYLLTPNLGTDKVYIYKVDYTNIKQPLTPADPAFVSAKPGSGPRHITFHPDSKYVYLIQELECMVTAYDYKDGKLTEKQTITMLAPNFKGVLGAADIHVSPDGKFLYGSNRGDANEIVIYAIEKDGKLNYAGRQSILGKTPRNFAIDPTGNFLLSANQMTDEVVIFKRDQKTGLLTPTGKNIKVSRPVCMKFVK